MAPHHLAVVEEELAADLHGIPAPKDVALPDAVRIFQTAVDGANLPAQPRGHADVPHVLRPLRTEVDADHHSQLLEQHARGIGVDGERAFGEFLVLSNEVGLAAADDDDAGWDRDGEVIVLGDAGAEGAQVCLAGAAVEVPHEEHELTRVKGIGGVVEGAEGTRRAGRVVDGDVVDGGQGRPVRTVVPDRDGQIRVGAEAGEPLVGVGRRKRA